MHQSGLSKILRSGKGIVALVLISAFTAGCYWNPPTPPKPKPIVISVKETQGWLDIDYSINNSSIAQIDMYTGDFSYYETLYLYQTDSPKGSFEMKLPPGDYTFYTTEFQFDSGGNISGYTPAGPTINATINKNEHSTYSVDFN